MKNLSDIYKLKITNSLTNNQEVFEPIKDKQVLMYVCGITPYDYAHIGHGRCYVTFDLLFRFLGFLGYTVKYCRNFTDVDDKLINRAIKETGNANNYLDISVKFINAYHENMASLNCLPPTYEPRVTTTIPEIIAFIEGLIKNSNAYNSDGDVYYSINSFGEYGKLSKRDLEDLKAGARIAVREDKKNPLDFALWKKEPRDMPGWESPWGWGRPGWHIECSAMAKSLLGETIDIHAGGMDLIFPHHENEIAQSEGLHHKTFSRYWMHNAFVVINKEKMSKSLGNFVTLHDLFKQFKPMILRYYFLSHHYRHPLDFSLEDVNSFSKSYQRLSQFFHNYNTEDLNKYNLEDFPVVKQMLEALCDDLNTAKLFGIVFENLKVLSEDKLQVGIIKSIFEKVMGIIFEPLEIEEVIITPEIQALIDERETARREKDWAKSDQLRDKLKDLGFNVQDKKS